MRKEYAYDKENMRFRKVTTSAWKVVRRFLLFLLVTMSMTVLYYVLFALVFSSDAEKRLKQENDLYKAEIQRYC